MGHATGSPRVVPIEQGPLCFDPDFQLHQSLLVRCIPRVLVPERPREAVKPIARRALLHRERVPLECFLVECEHAVRIIAAVT
jgi:hypothetical protein